MILAIETTALCIVFFLLCFLGTGTDEKNLKNYSSYPDEVQNLINEIAEYRGRYKEHSKAAVFLLNFLLFLFLFFILGLFIRDSSFLQNFVSLTIMGQSLTYLIFWSLTFYGGGIQNAFVLQKYPKKNCIGIRKNIYGRLSGEL